MENLPPLEPYNGSELELEKSNGRLIKKLTMNIHHSSSSLGSPSSANSSDQFMFQGTSKVHEEANSLINFNGGFDHFIRSNGSSSSSLLSFQQEDDDVARWYNNYQWANSKVALEDIDCLQRGVSNGTKDSNDDWLSVVADDSHEPLAHDLSSHKRTHMGENNVQAMKKQCNNTTKKTKPKSTPSKDPQSIAAKNRRERISERLKTLQELVPNGSKVDLVTMLEKAISYVKFLQLQVKVLATDEFWPVQGGKAPDISQVKEAIDAILSSSQRDRNSSSSSK